jgi:hypothetical protein
MVACQPGPAAKIEPGQISAVWTSQKAQEWYDRQPWLVGADFIPSTAVNQLEMWQADSFDTATIAKELHWAGTIVMNTMRVYLHHLAWLNDSTGFLNRVDRYLAIANREGIRTIFVIFDDCWNKDPKPGAQPAPRPGVHNSGWLQDPGDPYSKDTSIFPTLAQYVKAVIGHFATDQRILLWDLYNEPGNSGKGESSLPLLVKTFEWARSVHPGQPLSAGLYDWNLTKLNQFITANSDVITYHDYDEAPVHRHTVEVLQAFGKPLICTEYMARTRGSRFETILPILKEKKVGAINWGLVAGKTNTIYAWDTPMPDGKEPRVWFHDIFRKDGTPYDSVETKLIRTLTATK